MKNRLHFTRMFIGSAPSDHDETLKNLKIKVEEKEETAAYVVDLEYVMGVFESISNEGENRPDQCAIERFGRRTVWIATPYKEMIEILREYRDGDAPGLPLAPDLGQAIKTLAQALNADPELYSGWRANIAMAFYDAFPGDIEVPSSVSIIGIANQAAGNFLDNLIKSVE